MEWVKDLDRNISLRNCCLHRRETIASLFFLPLAGEIAWQREPVSAETLERIKSTRKLTIAVKDNIRPFGFRNDRGELVGLEIDIARGISNELFGDSNVVELKPIINRDRLLAVADGNVDAAIARLTVNGSRSRIVDFSKPYYIDGTGLLAKRSISLSGLRKGRIGILKGSTTEEFVRFFLPEATIVGADSYLQGKSLLDGNSIQAFAADRGILIGWQQEFPGYFLLRERLSAENIAIAMARGYRHDSWRNFINATISKWQASGWLASRIQFWQLDRVALPQANRQ
jgi:polar amino acid transport system substrate-binding protein